MRSDIRRAPRRTAALRAITDCVIAIAARDQIDRRSLASLAELHHREDPYPQETPR